MRARIVTLTIFTGLCLLGRPADGVKAADGGEYSLLKFPYDIYIYDRTPWGRVPALSAELDATDLVVKPGYPTSSNRVKIWYLETLRENTQALGWAQTYSYGINCTKLVMDAKGIVTHVVSGNCNTETTKITDVNIFMNVYTMYLSEPFQDDSSRMIEHVLRHETMHGLGKKHNADTLFSSPCSPNSVINLFSDGCDWWSELPSAFTNHDTGWINDKY